MSQSTLDTLNSQSGCTEINAKLNVEFEAHVETGCFPASTYAPRSASIFVDGDTLYSGSSTELVLTYPYTRVTP